MNWYQQSSKKISNINDYFSDNHFEEKENQERGFLNRNENNDLLSHEKSQNKIDNELFGEDLKLDFETVTDEAIHKRQLLSDISCKSHLSELADKYNQFLENKYGKNLLFKIKDSDLFSNFINTFYNKEDIRVGKSLVATYYTSGNYSIKTEKGPEKEKIIFKINSYWDGSIKITAFHTEEWITEPNVFLIREPRSSGVKK